MQRNPSNDVTVAVESCSSKESSSEACVSSSFSTVIDELSEPNGFKQHLIKEYFVGDSFGQQALVKDTHLREDSVVA